MSGGDDGLSDSCSIGVAGSGSVSCSSLSLSCAEVSGSGSCSGSGSGSFSCSSSSLSCADIRNSVLLLVGAVGRSARPVNVQPCWDGLYRIGLSIFVLWS